VAVMMPPNVVPSSAAFVGVLGPAPGQNVDLYAIELGARGGSDYLIVHAPHEMPIKRLTVLDIQCEDDNGRAKVMRDVELRRNDKSVVQPTDYCVVKSVLGLRALALEALKRKPLAVLEWVGEVPASVNR